MKESDVKRLETAIRNLKTVQKSLSKVWVNTSRSMESMPCIYNTDARSLVSTYVGEMVMKVAAAQRYVADLTNIFIKELKIE